MIEITIVDGYAYVSYKGDKSSFNSYVNTLMKIEGREWCKKNNCWRFNKNKLFSIKKAFSSFNVTSESIDEDDIESTMKLKPYPYQKEAIKFAIQSRDSLLVLPCGSGKTCLMIGSYIECKRKNIVKGPGIIIVKASLKTQWLKEVSKFSDEKAVIIQTESEMTSKYKARVKKLKERAKKASEEEKGDILKRIAETEKEAIEAFNSQFVGYDIFIMNYETLRDEAVRKSIIKTKAEFCACDEIQMLKSHKSLRSKATYELSPMLKVRIGATATPVTKDPRDIFGLFKFIKPDLFSSFTNFARMYINYSGPGRISGFRNMDNLKNKIGPYLLVKTKEEISDQLPSLVVSQKYCDMTPQQEKMNEIIMAELEELKEKEFKIRRLCKTEAEIQSNEEIMKLEAMILAMQTFAQELVCSPELFKLSESEMAKKYYVKSENPKLELCAELVEQIIESGEKVCIFSKFERMQSILAERIKKIDKNIGIAYVNGGINHKQRSVEVYDKFQGDPNCKVLLMSNSGAEGLNLSSIKYLVEYDLADSYSLQTQRHGRLERADSIHDTVFVYQLIMNNSFDEISQKIIEKKEGFDLDLIKSLAKN